MLLKTTQTIKADMQTTQNTSDMDLQMDADRNYFEQFPKARSYSRTPFKNEIKQCLLVHCRHPKQIEVTNFGQGLRVKRFIF